MYGLAESEIRKITSTVIAVLEEAVKIDPTRTGGYFCLADADTGFPILLMAFGAIPPEKTGKYLRNALEKASRLAAYLDHNLSRQSRNPALEHWTGSVRTPRFIFSFSGFQEDVDEAAMIVSPLVLGEISQDEAQSLVDIGRNRSFEPLCAQVRRLRASDHLAR